MSSREGSTPGSPDRRGGQAAVDKSRAAEHPTNAFNFVGPRPTFQNGQQQLGNQRPGQQQHGHQWLGQQQPGYQLPGPQQLGQAPGLRHLQGNLRTNINTRFLEPTASRMEGRQQNSRYPSPNPTTLPSRPHSQVQTGVSNRVMTPPGDSRTQGQGSASGILFPTSPQTNVYDPRLLQDMTRPLSQPNNGMPNSNIGFRVGNSQMLDPNLPGSRSQYPHPIRGPPNIAPGGYMLGNSAPNGGSTNARTNPPGSLAGMSSTADRRVYSLREKDQFRRTIPSPIPRMQGFVPPPDQTSFAQGGRLQPSPPPTLLDQFDRETRGVPKQDAREDEEEEEEEEVNAENGTNVLADVDFASMSLKELLALHKEHFGEYVCDSWMGLNGEVYNANNLPPALFELEPSVDHPPRRLAFEHGFINGPDGLPIKGPNGRSIIKFPVLPRYISTAAEGWCYEAWDRMDRGIEDSDYVTRMNTEEFKLIQAINKAQLTRSRKKAAETKAKKAGKTQKGRRQPAQSAEKKKSERGLMQKNFINGINMRRTRAFRLPFGVFAWDKRSGKGDPSMKECQAVSGLSEESISHNTSLEVTPQGLQRVRIEGRYGELRTKINLEGQFWPHDKFLTDGKLHTPTPRLRECRKIALDLNEKLKQYNKKEWKDLPREELPVSWFAKADKAKERLANKRKAEEDLDNAAEASHDVQGRKKAAIRGSKKARAHESVGNSSGELGSSTYDGYLGPMQPYQMQPRTLGHYDEHQQHYPDPTALGEQSYTTSGYDIENMPANWQGESSSQGAMYCAPNTEADRTGQNSTEFDDFAYSYRRGMMQHVEENLRGDVNLYNATDPEFNDTLQAEMQAEWRRRMDDPDADSRERSALEALRGEFGN